MVPSDSDTWQNRFCLYIGQYFLDLISNSTDIRRTIPGVPFFARQTVRSFCGTSRKFVIRCRQRTHFNPLNQPVCPDIFVPVSTEQKSARPRYLHYKTSNDGQPFRTLVIRRKDTDSVPPTVLSLSASTPPTMAPSASESQDQFPETSTTISCDAFRY